MLMNYPNHSFSNGVRCGVMLLIVFTSVHAQQPSVTVVDVIPQMMSNETHQDSEPNIAVNPANSLQMAISAFTPGAGFCAPNIAPIFISLNGGRAWGINCIVPSDQSGMTDDISMKFAGAGGNLYAGILRKPGEFRLNILRTISLVSPELMTVLVDREGVDQPYVEALNLSGSDRVYVGSNDFDAPNSKTATIDYSLRAHVAGESFHITRIESRSTARQNGPAIRSTLHADGTIYALFYGWRSLTGDFDPAGTITTDVVVVREDNGAGGQTQFADLKDSDGLFGKIVSRDRRLPWYRDSQRDFGNERFVASDLSIAVDPRPGQSGCVYVAWADRVGEDDYTLHVRFSTDRGATWSSDVRTVTNAINPALAINSEGVIGFMYQQLTGKDESPRWETRIELTSSESVFRSTNNLLLATVPAKTPDPQFVPYIGDYIHLMTVGADFYGVFSANNTPNEDNFPNKVVFQRNHDFHTKQLLRTDNVTPTAPSIDPFFVKVSP